MRQTKKAGTKEFFISLLLIFLTITISGYIKLLIPAYAVIADLLCLFLLCGLAFLILVHYTAIYSYIITGSSIKLNRTIGKRNKEIEFPISSVVSVSSKKPDTKYIHNFSPKILKGKNTKYITFDHNRLVQAVIIEADKEMNTFLKKFKNID